MSNTLLCNVKECRFPYSHLTCAHKCGNCAKYGHGKIECTNHSHIVKYDPALRLQDHDTCSIYNCCNVHTHTSDSHNNDMLLLTDVQIIYTCLYCKQINTGYTKLLESTNKCIICFESANIQMNECKHNLFCYSCYITHLANNNTNTNENTLIEHLYNKEYIKNILHSFLQNLTFVYTSVHLGMGCSFYCRKSNNNHIQILFIHNTDSDLSYDHLIQFIQGYTYIELEKHIQTNILNSLHI